MVYPSDNQPQPFLFPLKMGKFVFRLTMWPGFSWDRVNFPSGSWCRVVFWIWDENNVGNIPMLLVVAR